MHPSAAVRARRWSTLGLLTVGLAGALPFPAGAVTYTVNPVKLELSAAVPSTLVTISNTSDEPVSFQVSGFRWSMDEAGESRLDPTEDLLFFPLLLTVEPKAERKLRVGATVPFGGTEGSYRLIVEELRPPQSSSGVNVRILTKMSIPVFLAPGEPRREARIADAALAGGTLAFRVENRGTVHLPPHKVVLAGTNAAGDTVFARQLDGWYVLPGNARLWRVELPPNICPELAALVIQVRSPEEGGIDLSERIQPGPGACGPAV